MPRSSLSLLRAALVVGIAAVPATAIAFAGHGKPGLWQISTKVDMGNLFTPEQAAQMRAHGVKIPRNDVITVTHCVTPEEAAMDRPPESLNRQKTCKMQNLKIAGNSVSADMACNDANMQGGGHFELIYDTQEHYTGKASMSFTARGRHVATNTTMEGKWLSANCKAK